MFQLKIVFLNLNIRYKKFKKKMILKIKNDASLMNIICECELQLRLKLSFFFNFKNLITNGCILNISLISLSLSLS